MWVVGLTGLTPCLLCWPADLLKNILIISFIHQKTFRSTASECFHVMLMPLLEPDCFFSEGHVLQLDKRLEGWDRSGANDCCPADFAFSMAFGQVDIDVTMSKCLAILFKKNKKDEKTQQKLRLMLVEL